MAAQNADSVQIGSLRTTSSSSFVVHRSIDRAHGMIGTFILAILSGVALGKWIPRGPVDAQQGLWLIAGALGFGFLCGFFTRSRLAIPLSWFTAITIFELMRRSTDGPTVDGIDFGSTYGVLVLIAGRGLFWLLTLLPLSLGVLWGKAVARRGQRSSHMQQNRLFLASVRRGIAGLSTIFLVVLCVLIAWPASVPPIVGADGKTIPGSIAELTSVPLGGHSQWIEIRGADPRNPVLLWLDGGPGEAGLSLTRVFLADLTTDFTVVGWDQRGAGKSYGALDPASTLTLDQAVEDTIELTNYLRERFNQEKIILAGGSWGSTLGVLAVQRRPDLYHAWIGSGQMVDQLETDQRIYDDLMAFAARTGDQNLTKRLQAFGPPPYDDPLTYAFIMQHYEDLAGDFDPLPGAEERMQEVGPFGVLGSEYTFIEKTNIVRGLADMFSVMYPQLQEIDFRNDVPELQVPVFILLGEHELAARSDIAREWFAALQAPHKEIFTIANAGHGAAFEGYEEFGRILRERVLPLI